MDKRIGNLERQLELLTDEVFLLCRDLKEVRKMLLEEKKEHEKTKKHIKKIVLELSE